ncbi:MAG TPA: transcriptional repressor LexA [Candidatus Paceibacterota bacterium]|nr:transcriptional repressor LexA [Candidatus Paceibacterota bacterium]
MKGVREKIISFYQKHRRMPSYSEIMKLTGYKTKSAVSYALDKLIALGVVAKDEGGKLIPKGIGQFGGQIKMLGLVEAGFPSAAEEELSDTMSFDDYLIEKKESTYILRVKGDSMIEAGINDGDMVIVERGAPHKNGDIVIAEVDGEWTIKFFRKEGGKIFLSPANKKYQPIYPKEELKISAVVKAVVRKY